MTSVFDRLEMRVPIVLAPMAGVSTPELAAAVSDAGGLGSIGIGATAVAEARRQIRAIRALTRRAFNVNVFCHRAPRPDVEREARWLAALAPLFSELGAPPPETLTAPNASFLDDDAMLAMLLEEKPPVVSFHFGVPPVTTLDALRASNIVLFATATNLEEARTLARAGVDAIVAQGFEAGGHRGVFDADASDERLGTHALTRLLVEHAGVPVIPAGGIMDGAGVATVLALGAGAAQLGTAFIACPESSASDEHRRALVASGVHTSMTRACSGRPARALANHLTDFVANLAGDIVPDFPLAYSATKALARAARATNTAGYAPQFAGQGAALARALPGAELVRTLVEELKKSQGAR